MDELVGKPASAAGMDGFVAAKSVGIHSLLRSDHPSDKILTFNGKTPVAQADVAVLRGGAGATKPPACGLTAIGEVQDIARELFRFGRDQIGAAQSGETIAGTPGLSQSA
jgi:hypothetical protein